MEGLTQFADYFRKIPAAFLVAINTIIGLILFLPLEYAKIVAVDGFRDEYRLFIGPAFLLTFSFLIARIFNFFKQRYNLQKQLKIQQKSLHELTPEEKGYLVPYIEGQQNTIYVGAEDGIMGGLHIKEITYRASSMGSFSKGIAFNLQPWARAYLEKNKHLLNGYTGKPMTPQDKEKSYRRY